MYTLKTILFVMLVGLEMPLSVGSVENDAMGHPITSQTTELSIPLTEMDDATLMQYALQLREAKPELFAGAQGVLVLGIVPDSQAEKKGLRRGDIVVAYNKQQMNSNKQLISTVQSNSAKPQVELQFIRAEIIQGGMLQGGEIGIYSTSITKKIWIKFRQISVITRLDYESQQAAFSGDFFIALEKLQQGLQKARILDDIYYIAPFLKNLALIYLQLEQHQKALQYYQQALELYQEIGDNHEMEQILINICFILLSEGEKAIDVADYSTALEKFKNGLQQARILGDKNYISQFLGNLGMVHNELEQHQQSLDYYLQALPLLHEIYEFSMESSALSEIGNNYFLLGKYNDALHFYEQSLDISSKLGETLVKIANLNGIGHIYHNQGKYEQALHYHEQALASCKEINERNCEGRSLFHIGHVYFEIRQLLKALEYYQKALEIFQKSKDRRSELRILTGIGDVYDQLGADKEVLLQDYICLLQEIEQTASKYDKILIIRRIGNLYLHLGQYEEALSYYQQDLMFSQEIENKLGESMALNNIALVYSGLEQYEQAVLYFYKSLYILKNLNSLDMLWRVYQGLAGAEAKLTNFTQAVISYEHALTAIENIRAKLTIKEHKLSVVEDKLFVYDDFIELLNHLHQKHSDKGYDKKSLGTFERKQGRVFLEEMGKSGARRFAALDNEIIEAEQSLTIKWQQVQSFSPQERAALEQAEEVLKKRIKVEYPKYYALKYPQPVDLATLQNQVLQKCEMVLVYGMMEESTILWVIGKHQFQMLTLNISEEKLQAKVEAFRASPNTFIEAIKTEPSWAISDLAEDNLPSLRQASYDLYQLLMPEKARTLLKDARTLYIVPTGPLYGLPFGALDTHNPAQHDTPHYLIQDYPIAYLSSASLLKTIRETERKESARYPFLAFADPEYPENCSSTSADATQIIQSLRTQSYLKLAGSENKGCFQELPETKAQAETIAKLLKAPKHSNALQLRAKASRQNVFDFSDKKRLNDYQYVLFAAHAVLPYEITRINQSAIVLSNPDTEGYLTMADAFALDMNADLVMLSACNTGRGEKIKGEGIRGLTRAFMYAGTPAVSVSLWSVESRSAKALSISLFKYLQDGKPLAQALRQSKLDLMADEDMDMYQHPYFWAPFVVFGDGN